MEETWINKIEKNSGWLVMHKSGCSEDEKLDSYKRSKKILRPVKILRQYLDQIIDRHRWGYDKQGKL